MASQPSTTNLQSVSTPDRLAVLRIAGVIVGLLLAAAMFQLNSAAGIGIGVVALGAGVVAWGRRGRGYPPRHAKSKS